MAPVATDADTPVMRTRVVAISCCISALSLGVGGATAATPRPPRTFTAPSQSNQTVHMHVGDKLKVHLGTSYRHPHSSRPKVLERLSYSGGYGTNTDARATFKAIATGRADVTAETDYPCLHTTPRCELAQQIYVVHVVVKQ